MREFRLFSARKIYPGEDERWSQEQVWPGPGRPAEEEDRTAPELQGRHGHLADDGHIEEERPSRLADPSPVFGSMIASQAGMQAMMLVNGVKSARNPKASGP